MRQTVGEIIGAPFALCRVLGFQRFRDKGIKNDKTRQTCVLRAKRYLQGPIKLVARARTFLARNVPREIQPR